MKITSISVSEVYRVRSADLAIDTPIVLLCGTNEAGKSSVIDAIRLALTGDAVRVGHKKDWPQIVNDQAKQGSVTVTGDGWQASVVLPSGKRAVTGLSTLRAPLESSLSPAYFSGLKPDERRGFLFDLLGLKLNASTVAPKLEARGIPAELMTDIVPLLGAMPMADVAKRCAEMATGGKGAWRQVTDEVWGEVKGASWLPAVPTAPQDSTPAGVAQDITKIEAEIAEYQQAIGVQVERSKAWLGYEAKADDLRKAAGALAARKTHYDTTAKNHNDTLAKFDAAKARAEGGNAPREYHCWQCGAKTMVTPAGLEPYAMPEKVADPEAAHEAQKLRGSLDMLIRALDNAKRDLDDAQKAKAALEALEASPPEAPADVSEIRSALTEAQDRLRTLRTHEQMHRDHEQAKATAAKRRDEAAALHANILGWLALAEALGPSGIQAETLSEALAEFNGRLEFTSRTAHWAPVMVRDDMEILIGGRPYGLVGNGSVKWRADALLAEACAFWSSRLLVLDAVDILDSGNRESLILMLDQLAKAGQLGTCILAATLKERPRGLPDTVAVHWLEGGRISQRREMEAA